MLQQAVKRQKVNLDALPPLGQGLLNREEVASYRMEQLLFLAEPLIASLPNSSQPQTQSQDQERTQSQPQEHNSNTTFENESKAQSLALRIERAALEESVTANRQTMYLVRRLEGTVGRILGPPNIFLRLKVNHPVVRQIVQEVLGRHLGSILYDKRDRENEELRKAVQRSMFRGQNWAQVEFLPSDEEKPKWNARGAKVLDGGAEALEEALRLSLQPEGQAGGASAEETEGEGGKRKCEQEDGPSAKKRKPNEEEAEEVEEGDEEEVKDIYAGAMPPVKHPQFPSILELLDIDIPVVEALVKDRSSVESILIVPDFDSFLHYPSLMAEKEMTLVGKDGDGKVATVRPSSFSAGNADNIVVGAIENPLTIGPPQEVGVWAGQDIRGRWPEFEAQLARLDAVKKAEEERRKEKDEEEEARKRESLEVKGVGLEGAALAPGGALLAAPEPLPSTSSGGNTSKAASSSSGSLMEQLAARGVVVIQKEVNNKVEVESSKDDEEDAEEEEDSDEEEEEEDEDLDEEEEGDEAEEEEEDYDEEALLIPG